MGRLIVNFASLMLAALVVGAMFGIWLAGNFVELTPGAYVQQQQHAIKALNVSMPVLGWGATLITSAAAICARSDRRRLALFVAALVCLVAAGLVTRGLNQPINSIVMTWSADDPPNDWTHLRDEWWRWHVLRTAFGIVGLSLLIVANLVRDAQQVPA